MLIEAPAPGGRDARQGLTRRRIAVLLSLASPDGRERRVLSGVVRGTAERQLSIVGRVLDIELSECYTWTVGGGHGKTREIAPCAIQPDYRALIRVAIMGTPAETMSLLEYSHSSERNLIPAVEVPFGTCWRCRQEVDANDVHCSGCGNRLRVGTPMATARPLANPPISAAPVSPQPTGVCGACRGQLTESGAFCARCGAAALDPARIPHPERLPRLVSLLAGTPHEAEVFLVEGRRRHGSFRVRCDRLEWAQAGVAGARTGLVLTARFSNWEAADPLVDPAADPAAELIACSGIDSDAGAGLSQEVKCAPQTMWARLHLQLATNSAGADNRWGAFSGPAPLIQIERWLAGNPITVSGWARHSAEYAHSVGHGAPGACHCSGARGRVASCAPGACSCWPCWKRDDIGRVGSGQAKESPEALPSHLAPRSWD